MLLLEFPSLRARLFPLICCSCLAGCWTMQSRRLFLLDASEMNVFLYFWGLFWKEASYFTLVGKLENWKLIIEKRTGVTGGYNEGSGVWVRLSRELLMRAWRYLEASLSVALFTLITLGHFELRRALVLSCWEWKSRWWIYQAFVNNRHLWSLTACNKICDSTGNNLFTEFTKQNTIISEIGMWILPWKMLMFSS